MKSEEPKNELSNSLINLKGMNDMDAKKLKQRKASLAN